MAMATYLQLVDDAELDALRKQPDTIGKLEKTGAEAFTTYYACSINWFVCGDAYPDPEDDMLHAMLLGADHVECKTLENGSFGVVLPKQAAVIAKKLASLDTKKISKAFAKADLDELIDEQEVTDLETLREDDEPVKALLGDIESLSAFYAYASKVKKGVVLYTT
jgi:hypothetical protein